MQHITLVMPYYDNPSMLSHHYAVWQKYSEHTKAHIDVVIVDDASPCWPAVNVPRPEGTPPVSIFRILTDIPWNQHGARNLGALQAKGPWLLMTDMDHVVPGATFEALIALQAKGKHVFTFSRVDAPDMKVTRRPDGSHKPHPNTFLVAKDLYWQIGGYDEDYCGMYGTDGMFRARLFKDHPPKLLDQHVIRYPREVIDDASTTSLVRRADGSTRGATAERTRWKHAQGRRNVIVTINFPWEQVL